MSTRPEGAVAGAGMFSRTAALAIIALACVSGCGGHGRGLAVEGPLADAAAGAQGLAADAGGADASEPEEASDGGAVPGLDAGPSGDAEGAATGPDAIGADLRTDDVTARDAEEGRDHFAPEPGD